RGVEEVAQRAADRRPRGGEVDVARGLGGHRLLPRPDRRVRLPELDLLAPLGEDPKELLVARDAVEQVVDLLVVPEDLRHVDRLGVVVLEDVEVVVFHELHFPCLRSSARSRSTSGASVNGTSPTSSWPAISSSSRATSARPIASAHLWPDSTRSTTTTGGSCSVLARSAGWIAPITCRLCFTRSRRVTGGVCWLIRTPSRS